MTTTTLTRTPAQAIALAFGGVFLLVGVLGFVPGITTDYGDLELYGRDSDAHLLGIFEVSVLHNLVHLGFGAAGIALARAESTARTFLVGGGAIYLVLWVYGLLVDKDSAGNFAPTDVADDWLHLALGLAMVGLGVATSRSRPVGPA